MRVLPDIMRRLFVCLLLTAAACAHAPVAPSDSTCSRKRDADAIRGLAGTFAVHFAFDEMESIAPGYVLHKPYRADATEVVRVIADNEQGIVLQHFLVDREDGAASVTKHWREDWLFEPAQVVHFSGHETWQRESVAVADPTAAPRCTWSQTVYEVDDGPSYAGVGTWRHDGGAAIWRSDETWRPLPRREYTQRSDYDVLIGINKLTVDATGWTHTQENRKWVTATSQTLASERGDTTYERRDSDLAATADKYWAATSAFWADVRAAWSGVLAGDGPIEVRRKVNDKPLYETLFPIAEGLANATPEVRKKQVADAIAPYVRH